MTAHVISRVEDPGSLETALAELGGEKLTPEALQDIFQGGQPPYFIVVIRKDASEELWLAEQGEGAILTASDRFSLTDELVVFGFPEGKFEAAATAVASHVPPV